MFLCQVSPTSNQFFVVADDDYRAMLDLLRNGAKKAIIISQRSCPNHSGIRGYEIYLDDSLIVGAKVLVRKVDGVGVIILPVAWMLRNGFSKEQWE